MCDKKMEKLRDLYLQYLKMRKSEDLDSIDFLREQIAQVMVSDANGLEWYMTRLQGRGYGFAPTYGDVALSCENKLYRSSLAESVNATEKRQRCQVDLLGYLTQFSDFRFMVVGGSFPWRRYLDLSHKDQSDLDVLVVCDQYDPRLNFGSQNVSRLVQEFHKHSGNEGLEVIKYKVDVDDIEVSVHCWSTAVFDEISQFDFAKENGPYVLRCLRPDRSKNDGQSYGPQHNFAGKSYYFDMDTRQLEDFFVSDQQIYLLGDDGELVLGAALDMLLFNPVCVGPDVGIFNQGMDSIVGKLYQRMILDGSRIASDNLSFSNLPSRKERMPAFFLSAISVWDKQS